MKKRFKNWHTFKESIGRIYHVKHDWLTPVEYLPYIDALLGDIDLDPCSTHEANAQFLRAKRIYALGDDGLNNEDPWNGKVYLFPPTYGRCSFNKQRGTWRWSLKAGAVAKAPAIVWFNRLLREWKLRNTTEALFFCAYPEMFRLCPEMWEYPVCIPTTRANLVHGGKFFTLQKPIFWGFFIYLPPLELGKNHTERFRDIFSNIGKVIC